MKCGTCVQQVTFTVPKVYPRMTAGQLFGWEFIISFILVSTVYACAIGAPNFGELLYAHLLLSWCTYGTSDVLKTYDAWRSLCNGMQQRVMSLRCYAGCLTPSLAQLGNNTA